MRLTANSYDGVKTSLLSNIVWSVVFFVAVVLLARNGWNSSFGAVSDKLAVYNVPSVCGLLLLFPGFSEQHGSFSVSLFSGTSIRKC